MCTDCVPNGPVIAFAPPPRWPCMACDEGECPDGLADSSCVSYNGPDLPCIGATGSDRLDQILQKIDARLCNASGGSLQLGNTFCLAPVANAEDFIEKISERYCDLQSSFQTFTATTFPSAIAGLNETISTLNHPGLSSCAIFDFSPDDTIKQSLFKIATRVCYLQNTVLDLSAVNWQQCFTVDTVPLTLQEGFDLVLDQLCVLQSRIDLAGPSITLTFDNTGSCLPAPGTTDSLETTIIKIRSRLCATPVFNAANLSAGCMGILGTDSLETVTDKMGNLVSDINSQLIRTVNPQHFTLVPVDVANPCAGKQLSLNTTLQDSRVAVTQNDKAPGTLEQKLAAGANITLDASSVPGKLVISSAGGLDLTNGFKVKTDAGDTSADYLRAKVEGVTNPLSSIVTTIVGGKVNFENLINVQELAAAILELFETDEELKSRLCMLLSGCPSPCQPPTDVEAVALP